MAKKSTVVLILVVGLLATNLTDNVYAQESWEIGIVSGPTKVLAKGTSPSVAYSSPQKIFFSSGLSVGYNMNEKFRLSTNVLYEQKGTVNYIVPQYSYDELQERLDYLSFPLLFEYSPFESIPVHAGVGASIGYLLNKKRQIVYTPIRNGEEQFVEYKKVNIGPIFEIDTKLPISNRAKVSVNLQHQFGVTDIIQRNGVSDLDDVNMQSTGIMVGFHYGMN